MSGPRTKSEKLRMEALEPREVPSVTTAFAGGTLTAQGDAGDDRVEVVRDASTGDLVIREAGREVGRVPFAQVNGIDVRTDGGNDSVSVAQDVTQPIRVDGGDGDDVLRGGGGPAELIGGNGNDKLEGGSVGNQISGGAGDDLLVGGTGADFLDGGAGADQIQRVQVSDTVVPDPADLVQQDPAVAVATPAIQPTLTADEVDQLIQRAAAASVSEDAIITVVDRNGRILGVRVEAGVSQNIQNNPGLLTFAIDGAVAKARTAAYFANEGAPLTSRTIQFISQTTITQREVESIPSITDPNSTLRGPGFVAPVGVGGHFPPGIALTPQVDLFGIEHTNRDSILHPGPDQIKGTPDDVLLPARFNIDPAFIPPGQELVAPESYGFQSGTQPGAQARGIGTIPGGIPLYRNGQMVGGIGVFFPGETGFATEENSALSTTFNPNLPDRTLEAEWMGLVAGGGVGPIIGLESGPLANELPIGTVGGVPPVPGFSIPFGRIDLVGITLDIIGPQGTEGLRTVVNTGLALGPGNPNSGTNVPVTAGADGVPNTGDEDTFIAGTPSPEGWLVMPHDGVDISAAEVEEIITRGFLQANRTRAAIRLPFNTPTAMIFAVTDKTGEVLGLFRMRDATFFSIDVAVAKARNVAYYADANALQPIDQVAGVPAGTAFTNRTFRYLSEPFFPEGIDTRPPGPFSVINDGGTDPNLGLQVGPRLPASAFQSVLGFDAFNPNTNFRDQRNILNQNGIVFFPGSAPVYKNGQLIGGFGVSGDGVDQDDVVTFQGVLNFGVPDQLLRADEVKVNNARLPYQKFNRLPEGGIAQRDS